MDIKEVNQFLHEFQKESDRAAAVLAGCYPDEPKKEPETLKECPIFRLLSVLKQLSCQ